MYVDKIATQLKLVSVLLLTVFFACQNSQVENSISKIRFNPQDGSVSVTADDVERLSAGSVLGDCKDYKMSGDITQNNVLIMRMDFGAKQDTVRFAFDKIAGLEQGVASFLFGDWESWTKPIVFNNVDALPDEKLMFTLWQHTDGTYGAAMPLCGGTWVTHLAGGSNGFGSVSRDWSKTKGKDVPFMAISFGTNPYQVVENLYADGMKAMDRESNLRIHKTYPEMFENLGWCTWNAMYEDVSEEKIIEGILSFRRKGIKIPWLLVDDGWLSIDDEKRLTSLEFDKTKFPNGMAPVVKNLENYGVEYVGVWHTMNGYWSGVHADKFGQLKSSLIPYRDKAGVHDAEWSATTYYSPNPTTGQKFYDTWYSYLATEGISFVKVDQQSVIKRLAFGLSDENNIGFWDVATGMETALQNSVQKHFDGRIINCQDMAIEALYNMNGSAIIRNSDDFFPTRTAYYSLEVEKGNAAAHTVMNIHNSLWTSQLAWPDYDMFQSHHVSASYHAALRAISGGPVYITDEMNKQDESIIKKLIDSNGRLFRTDRPALPAMDCLFNINKKQPLKAFSKIGNSGVLAIWNTDDADAVKGAWSPLDVVGLNGNEFVAYEHLSKTVCFAKADDSIPVNLSRMKYEYWNLVPLVNQCAVIGLVDKFNSRGAVLSEEYKKDQVTATLSSGGEIGIVLPNQPKVIKIDDSEFTGKWEYQNNMITLSFESTQEFSVSVSF